MKPSNAAVAALLALGAVFGGLLALETGAGRPAHAQQGVVGSRFLTPFQGAVTTAPTLLAQARPGRSSVTVVNGGSSPVEIGADTTVTAATGVVLPGAPGASITLPYTGAVYAVTATGTEAVSGYELY